MTAMVENSQLPEEMPNGGQTADFCDAVSEILSNKPVRISRHADPKFRNRELLAVDIGHPEGAQVLVATSHSDVVGVLGQKWKTDPWKLHEENEEWIGRGVCDAHGSGVAMLLAGLREPVRAQLERTRQRITILFTFDEESVSPELSMRGARLAAGLLGPPSIIQADQYIAGEPTENYGSFIPMRAHRGRVLARFTIATPHAGHVGEAEGSNILMKAASVIHALRGWPRTRFEPRGEDGIFSSPQNLVQVTAGDIKSGNYSITPESVSFVVDVRTLPSQHEGKAKQLERFILSHSDVRGGEEVSVKILKDAPGSATEATAPIVKIAEQAAGQRAWGFNGGDEGRIFRLERNMKGVTLGPGKIECAHAPDEHIGIQSVLRAADVYADIFMRVADGEKI